MKRVIILLMALTVVFAMGAHDKKEIVGYVTSWSDVMPDPHALTQINYAFGHVTDSFDSVRIDNVSRLRQIVDLKKKNKKLKVLLSVGGWGSGNFSEMAADKEKREKFAENCRKIADDFDLDGIDVDWEYPGSGAAGISHSPQDKDNYVLLMRDLRRALGKHRLLTLASPATVGFYEFKPIMPYVDYVNIMAYDLNRPPYHHSALFISPMSGDMTADEGVRAHLSAGIPAEKIVLGVPFYGHGDKSAFPDFVDYRGLRDVEGYTVVFDDVAGVPYMIDADGKMVVCFDNPESLQLKCRYVKENGLGGMMFWDYAGDTDDGELLKVLVENFR